MLTMVASEKHGLAGGEDYVDQDTRASSERRLLDCRPKSDLHPPNDTVYAATASLLMRCLLTNRSGPVMARVACKGFLA